MAEEPLKEYKSSEHDHEFQDDCTPEERQYPKREKERERTEAVS
jgi:hypothetical protein